MIVRANQWTGFYMIETSTMKELNVVRRLTSNTEEVKVFILLGARALK